MIAAPDSTAQAPALRSLLRTETHAAHEQLERNPLLTELASGHISRARYCHYLAQMHRFHTTLDAALGPHLPARYPHERLNQTARLADDLLALGDDAAMAVSMLPAAPYAALASARLASAAAAVCSGRSTLSTSIAISIAISSGIGSDAAAATPTAHPAAAWGVLYVIEGARLGSQILLKRNADNDAVQRAHAFISGEAGHTGLCWREFCVLLEQSVTASDHPALLAAANDTFVLLGDWLAEAAS